MNYHLNRQGQTVGGFSLKELQMRRQSGEFSGNELVWCEGMNNWETLDLVLHQKIPGVVLPLQSSFSVQVPKQKSKRTLVVAIVTTGFIIIAVAVGLRIVSEKSTYQAPAVLDESPPQTEHEIDDHKREAALRVAQQPVICTSNAATESTLGKKHREFLERHYLDGYKLNHDKVSLDPEVVELIQQWIAREINDRENHKPSRFAELKRKLEKTADADPIVLLIAGLTPDLNDWPVSELEKATAGFERSKYDAYPKFHAAVALAALWTQVDTNHVSPADTLARRWFKEAISDGSIRPQDQAEVADMLLKGWGKTFFSRNEEALEATIRVAGKSMDWLSLVLEGNTHIGLAWAARGNGYADTVTEEGWRGFEEHLSKARSCLTKAWELRPDFPLAPYLMMTVSLGSTDIEEMRVWFDRVVAAQLDHSEAWSKMRWGLRPRWYGDEKSMLAFGIMAANTKRYDTKIPRMLMDSISDLESELNLSPGDHVYGREDVWPHVQEMYEGYLAIASEGADRNRWHSDYGVVAYLGKKYEVAKQQLEIVQWQPWIQSLRKREVDRELMVNDVKMHTGSFGDELGKAEDQRNKGNFASALRIYSNLTTNATLEKATRDLVLNQQAVVKLESRLHKGEWVNFLPETEDFKGWNVLAGQWHRESDGSMEVAPDRNGHVAYSSARLGMDFEVIGSFEVAQTSTGDFQVGLVMGRPNLYSPGAYSFRMSHSRQGDTVAFTGSAGSDIVTPLTLDSHTNSFYFRFTQRKISATVNGVEVFKDVSAPNDPFVSSAEFLLGLGTLGDQKNSIINYRTLRVRKLSSH